VKVYCANIAKAPAGALHFAHDFAPGLLGLPKTNCSRELHKCSRLFGTLFATEYGEHRLFRSLLRYICNRSLPPRPPSPLAKAHGTRRNLTAISLPIAKLMRAQGAYCTGSNVARTRHPGRLAKG